MNRIFSKPIKPVITAKVIEGLINARTNMYYTAKGLEYAGDAASMIMGGGAILTIGKQAFKMGGKAALKQFVKSACGEMIKGKISDLVAPQLAKLAEEAGIPPAYVENAMKLYGAYKLSKGLRRVQAGEPPCFIAGTRIATTDGYKNIEDIRVGDYVLSRSEKTFDTAYKEVLNTFVKSSPDLVVLRYSTNDEEDITKRITKELSATPEHPVWSETCEGFVPVSELEAGEIISLDNGSAEVINVEYKSAAIGKSFRVYNFEVADWHTYFVAPDGEHDDCFVWVHNECIWRKDGKGVDIKVKFKKGWTANQKSSARKKVNYLTKGDTKVVKVPLRKGACPKKV